MLKVRVETGSCFREAWMHKEGEQYQMRDKDQNVLTESLAMTHAIAKYISEVVDQGSGRLVTISDNGNPGSIIFDLRIEMQDYRYIAIASFDSFTEVRTKRSDSYEHFAIVNVLRLLTWNVGWDNANT